MSRIITYLLTIPDKNISSKAYAYLLIIFII